VSEHTDADPRDPKATRRCFGDGDPAFERYHDEEWGFPVLDEHGVLRFVAFRVRTRPATKLIGRHLDDLSPAYGAFDRPRLRICSRQSRSRTVMSLETTLLVSPLRAQVSHDDIATRREAPGDERSVACLGISFDAQQRR
jgi:hypothetical protein